MFGTPDDIRRRAMLAGLATGVAALGYSASTPVNAQPSVGPSPEGGGGWLDARDFKALGDGKSDDTKALQAAINAGSESQRPVRLPPGTYPITRPLLIPSNTMLIGSAPGLGFGCRLEPIDCAAFVIGGKSESFHCSIENLMIWPRRGPAPDFIISIDNSYSVTFRNVRIHDAPQGLRRAAVLLLGDAEAGGHGRCNNIIWENLVVRNDSGQPPTALLATKGCGTHRFIAPCLENYAVLLDWRGGQIDLVVPYTERAGRYAVDCNIDPHDTDAYLNTFGGIIDCANSGLGCAIRSTTRNFNSFGTRWGVSADRASYVYGLPTQSANFYGIVPNLGNTGRARHAGITGWRKWVNFPQEITRISRSVDLLLPANGEERIKIQYPNVELGEYWARVDFNSELRGAQLHGFVSSSGEVTVIARNATAGSIHLSGTFVVECGVV